MNMKSDIPTTAALPLSSACVMLRTDCIMSHRRQMAFQKRALIRSATRKLLADRGYDDFHMNDLASNCGLAVQTLYNHLGGKDEILRSAIDEILEAQIAWAEEESLRTGTNFALVFCEMTPILTESDPKYLKAVASMLKSNEHYSIAKQIIEERCTNAYRNHLLTMREAGILKKWVNIDSTAHAIVLIVCTNLIEYISSVLDPNNFSVFDARNFRRELVMSIGLLLCGASIGSEVLSIEATLERIARQATS